MRIICCLGAALMSLGLAVHAIAQPAVSKLGPNVAADLSAAGTAEVFVLLTDPTEPSSSGTADGVESRRRAVVAQRAAVLSMLHTDEVRVHHALEMASGFTATVSAAGLAKLLADPAVERIDGPRWGSGAAAASSMAVIRADAVHRRDALGQGVTVAVLDTGVDTNHPDLAGSIVEEHCFCGPHCCPNGDREQSGPGSAFTNFLHGIHVAGIIVSKGIIAPEGVAPRANVVAVKVLDDANRGLLADWIAALDWVATQRPDVQAINMSLVSDALYSGTCDQVDSYTVAFAQELRALRQRGVLAFVASGNSGQSHAEAAPACVSAAVAVGATTNDDRIWPLTNVDTTLSLLAPGVGILSTAPNDTAAILSGTSMATPHVTGTAALLLGIHPRLDADTLESMLRDTGTPILDPRSGLTRMRVNALAAMNAVDRITRPVSGGGSGRTDCLAEWNLSLGTTMTMGPPATAVCRDNDAACDADTLSGQCTFSVSLCLNVSDPRFPRCATDAPITAFHFSSPSMAHPHDGLDVINAAALAGTLPALPASSSAQCGAAFDFVVPAGGTRWINSITRAADGRRDSDRLRFTCLVAQ